ncbi:Barstar [Andreprevotia sp. IGB-42]|uniref:barstar family protein n=1 Tax=Andreprevotia sp. IGB-42 TaxID=2497473 RepID=UPI00135A7AFB|nr:barstar family protein [Andreprevotia sp. IGB-42]KAF0811673.1 Barstar [Andreprevotia sp. IGB-42]
MPLKTRKAALKQIHSLDDVYDQLAAQLPFPAHFGRNLDALYDVLTGDLTGPVQVIWHHADDARAALGDHFETLLTVFNEAAAERDDLDIVID